MKFFLCVSLFFCVVQHVVGMGLVGGWSNVDKTKLDKLTSTIEKSITTNLNQSPPELIQKGDRNGYYSLKTLHCALVQVVAGEKYSVHYVASVGNNDNSDIYCTANVYVQPWNDFIEVSHVTCKSNKTIEWSYCVGNAHKHKTPKVLLDDAENPFLFMGAPIMDKLQKVQPTTDLDDQKKHMFNMFLQKYNKDYSELRDVETYKQRFEIFKTNLKVIAKLNNVSMRVETNTAVYGITKFMDLSQDEFKNYMGFNPSLKKFDLKPVDVSDLDAKDLPDSVDWRKLGAVTAVKNQGQCGSCWAFSTTGNVEGQWFIKHKKLISLSEQELVDCDTVDQGCNGGLPSNAYKSIEKLGGLEGEKDYPYMADGEKCKFKSDKVKVSISDSVSLPQDETKLASWLAKNGPISIGINANMMQFYWGGIAHPWKIFCNHKSLDHGVLIVGFGTENGTPYWIIKNSWGPDWGEKGYYRIYRGDGSCGLNMMATSSIAA